MTRKSELIYGIQGLVIGAFNTDKLHISYETSQSEKISTNDKISARSNLYKHGIISKH